MMTSFSIRKFRDNDKEQCRALWRELTEWHREIYGDPTIGGETPEGYFDKHLAKVGSDQLWVAVHDSLVVGLVGLIFEGSEAEIEPLIVARAYRGNGIGTQLIKSVISEARNKGVRLLKIGPVARNVEAIKFLYKQGFRNLGCVELFMDLSDRAWKLGPEIFGCKFDF